MTSTELLTKIEALKEQVKLLSEKPTEFPFITYAEQEKLYHKFLMDYAGLSRAKVKKEQEEDNEYLLPEQTYEGIKEIFNAGFEAAEELIKKRLK